MYVCACHKDTYICDDENNCGMLRLLEDNFHNNHECHINIITWQTF